LPYRQQFAVSDLLDGVSAHDTLVHVVFEQQPASLGQILAQIPWDERLKIFAAPQFA
jgi:hypothetical protein